MFFSLPLYIGLRYTRAKRRNHFISFISLASMIGIALGVTVLITVLSVMNGFDYEIHNRIFSMAEQVVVQGSKGGISDWEKLNANVTKNKSVVAAAPFVNSQGMVSKDGAVQGVMVRGILPEQEAHVSTLGSLMVQGKMADLKPGGFGIVLGLDLAEHLGVGLGDKLLLITPQASVTPLGIEPRFKRFTVVGIFHAGGGFESYDSGMVFLHLNDAQKLFQMGQDVSGLRLKVKNLYDAPMVADQLINTLSQDYLINDWTTEYGTYFKAIRMEKTTMFVVLLFIIAIAAFNLVSSLVMTVTDKSAEIAILKTLGASPRTILGIFMVQGSLIGCFGTLLGVIGGVLLALNAPALVTAIEHYFHVHFISSSVYFINYLPSKLNLLDVVHVGVVALLMSLLATIYPAWRAAQVQPAEALRYE